jgi:hypothetical protein
MKTIIGIILMLMMIIACRTPLEEGKDISNAEETATVLINAPGVLSTRSILSEEEKIAKIAAYHITIYDAEEKLTYDEIKPVSAFPISINALPIGETTFFISALNNENTIIAKGESVVTLLVGKNFVPLTMLWEADEIFSSDVDLFLDFEEDFISQILGMWHSEDLRYVYQFNSDQTIYEGQADPFVGNPVIFFRPTDGYHVSFGSLGDYGWPISYSLHEELKKESRLLYYTENTMQMYDWEELTYYDVTYIVDGDTIFLSNGEKLYRIKYTEPWDSYILTSIEAEDNPSPYPMSGRLSVNLINDEYSVTGVSGAVAANASIEVGVNVVDKDKNTIHLIIGKCIANDDGSFKAVLPMIHALFYASRLSVYATAPGYMRSSPTNISAFPGYRY